MNATIYILGILLQAIASLIALMQVRRAPRRLPWLLIALSSLLIVFRRSGTLSQVIASGHSLNPSEILTLIISLLFFLGVLLMSRFFREVLNTETNLRQQMAARETAEARFLQAQKMESVGTLAGGIAHDFNNLLTGVIGNLELAEMSLPANAEALSHLERVRRSTNQIADLTRQMLAYSGRGKFWIQSVNLTRVAREMGDLLHAAISKNARIEWELSENIPTIRADATQIRQILMNLIINASEALQERAGKIIIRTGTIRAEDARSNDAVVFDETLKGRCAYVDVIDTGIGMDASTLSRIFDPFFSTKFTGRGLGLAAVLGIVRGHKGGILVHSQPGEGTLFRVLFPEAPLTSESPSPSPAPLTRVDAPAKGHILVIDDEEFVRHVADSSLRKLGYQVTLANNGREGLDLFRQRAREFVAIILDLTMPEMNGDEVFRAITAINSEIPVILTSGYAEEDVLRRFGSMAPAGFLQKPYTQSRLVEALDAARAKAARTGDTHA